MKEIAILNFTRFGDQVQATPVLTGLRKRHPDARIHLIMKSFFRGVTELLPGVDVIHEVEGDDLAGALTDPDLQFVERYRAIRRIIQPLLEQRFDVVFNFTHSISSAVLLSMLDAGQLHGAALDRDGGRVVRDPWLAHIATVVRARRLAPFNLVDLYLGSADLLGCGERLSIRVSEPTRSTAASLLPGGDLRIGVQLGASDEIRAWTLERFAETLRQIHARVPGVRFVLLGVRSELERARALELACPGIPFDNLVTRTDICDLAAVLERLRLLLTPDTGTMHLAAAVGTPTCSIFLGPAYPHETGPYAEDHWVVHSRIECAPCNHQVQCGYPVCHTDVPPEWLAEVCVNVVTGEEPQSVPRLPRAELLRSRFDEDGVWELVPAHRRSPDPEDLLCIAYRAAFKETLGGPVTRPERIWESASKRFGVEPGGWNAFVPDDLLTRLRECSELAQRAGDVALELARPAADPTCVKDRAAALQDVDERIREITRAQPLLHPLGYALDSDLQSLPEADLPILAQESARHYHALHRRTVVLESAVRGPDETIPPPAKEARP
jgi:ADP-heptose:LPS heptosyltransferase